ncbi:MAG: EAL domain-containing protein [Acidimicrobiales bacterium]
MPVVTSTRLATRAAVQSRLFPKIRSWFALGMPLELLSPLAVLRVVFPVCAALWCVQVSWLQWPGERRAWIYAIAGVAAAVWVALLCVRRIGALACHALAALGAIMVAGLIWAGRDPAPALGFSPYFIPFLIFVSLFLVPRAAFVHLAYGVAVFWLALWPVIGIGYAALVAVVAGVAVAAAPMAVILLAGAAARSGAIDPETGLANQVGLTRRVAAAPDGGPLLLATVLLAGIDEAREALGHAIGADLLRRAVEDLGQVIPADAVMARVESDELVVVRPLDAVADTATSTATSTATGGEAETAAGDGDGPSSGVPSEVHEEGVALGRILVDAVAAGRYVVGRVEVALRPHVGLVFSPWDGEDLGELLRRTSLAARQAHENGRAHAVWEDPQGTLTVEDLALLADLRLAPERGELHLAFQPQIHARSTRTVSAEALLRWRSQRHGNVPPGRFIVLAERTGYIDRLTEWVLAEALDAQARWRKAGVSVPVSVNFSAKTLRRPDLPAWVLGELLARDLPPSALVVEVTETAATELVSAVRLLHPLRERGVRVSIDDFGTGHTSLAVLPHLPLDELKVDMSFVLRSGESPADEAIVRSVLELAHRLGLDAVAEGVENDDIRRRMTDLGYDLLQGNHFAVPLAEDDFLEFARASGCATAAGA